MSGIFIGKLPFNIVLFKVVVEYLDKICSLINVCIALLRMLKLLPFKVVLLRVKIILKGIISFGV